jgi:hypothetical protein
MMSDLVEVCGGQSDTGTKVSSSAGMYEVGSKYFRPDIQKPRQMENAAKGCIAPSVVRLMYQFQAATCWRHSCW